jgi:hypothetical protein
MADYPSSAGKKIGHSFFHLVSSAIISWTMHEINTIF